VPEAVELYRKILASQPDHTVVIITVGFLTNLSNLLQSGPDKYSPLDGQALVRQKVRDLVSMAGTFPKGKEFNIFKDAGASLHVFTHWPGPVLFSGYEIGKKIKCGLPLIHDETIRNSPVKDAYAISLTYDGSKVGHSSWDQTAVLVAVKGIAPYFKSRQLNFIIKNDGKDSVMAGHRITYLIAKQKTEEMSKIIEGLMMHQPGQNE